MSDDDLPEQTHDGRFKGTFGPLGGLWNNLFRNFTSIVPFTERLYHNMAVKAMTNLHRKAGGDAIGLVATAGQQLDLEPVKYISAEEWSERDDTDQPGWKSKRRDKTWAAGTEGQVVDYLGKAPIVLLQDDAHVESGWQRSRIAQALDLDQHQPIFNNPQIDVKPQYQVDFRSAPGEGVADGGELDLTPEDLDFYLRGSDAEVVEPGEYFGDSLIDLSSPQADDGMRVSHRKAQAWFSQQSDAEFGQRQQDRGYLMGKLGKDEPNAFKYLLVAGAIVVLSLLAVFVLPEVLGGGGGGGGDSGGGIVPFMLGLKNMAGALGVV